MVNGRNGQNGQFVHCLVEEGNNKEHDHVQIQNHNMAEGTARDQILKLKTAMSKSAQVCLAIKFVNIEVFTVLFLNMLNVSV